MPSHAIPGQMLSVDKKNAGGQPANEQAKSLFLKYIGYL